MLVVFSCFSCPSSSLLIDHFLSPVKDWCDFEGGDTCGWKNVDSSVQIHAFCWSPDQGESIHDDNELHRPINDHTLCVAAKHLYFCYRHNFRAETKGHLINQ